MKHVVAVSLAIAALLCGGEAAAQDLERARALYAAASYEEALETLDATPDSVDANLVEQYRALCYLALDRQPEAEEALERIILRSPLYQIDAATVSPKLVDFYSQVRRRTLPKAARLLYREAKQRYDLGRLDEARVGFTVLLEVTKEAATSGGADSVQDLQQLADGFLVLAEATLAAQAEAAAEAAVPEGPEATLPEEPDEPVSAERRLYSAADADVTPPKPISRDLPRWVPPSGPASRTTLTGVLQVVVDEQGQVERAEMLESTWPSYDRAVLEAARTWRFEPATRDGVPVQFAMLLNIVLNPPD